MDRKEDGPGDRQRLARLEVYRESLGRKEFKVRQDHLRSRGTPVGRAKAICRSIRLVDLLDAPAEIPFFSEMIQREIFYRLLRCPRGDRLRAAS